MARAHKVQQRVALAPASRRTEISSPGAEAEAEADPRRAEGESAGRALCTCDLALVCMAMQRSASSQGATARCPRAGVASDRDFISGAEAESDACLAPTRA